MANHKKEEKEGHADRRYSEFDAPAIGMIRSKVTSVRHNPDGIVTLISPETDDSNRNANKETDEKNRRNLTEKELIEQLLILYPDRLYSSVTSCPLYSELSALAKKHSLTARTYLDSLGFSKKPKGVTEKQILNRLRELYPSGEYPSVGDIKQKDPELHKQLFAISKESSQTVMRYLSLHDFRKAAEEIHSNRLDHPWDRRTLKRLYQEYEVTFEQLASLFNCSKQTISTQINSRKDNGNQGGWETALNEQEFHETEKVIASGETFSGNALRTVLILTGLRNRSIKAAVYKTPETISCIFNAEHIFAKAFATRDERFADKGVLELFVEIENAWIRQGRMTAGRMKLFQCTAPMANEIRKKAEERGKDIAEFLKDYGYAITDKDSVTRDRLSKYIVSGTKNTVSISTKDTFYRTLSTAARRKGFPGIREYIESFGFVYESRRHDSSTSFRTITITSPEAVARTIERIRPYVIPGTNTVEIDTSSPDYNYLVFTANARGFSSFKEMLAEYGFYYESKRRGKRSRSASEGYDPDVLEIIIDRYMVDDTHLYISSYDPFYYRLNNYALSHGKKMDEFLAEHGYIRIRTAYDLPDGYTPYDYTDDLLLRINDSWSEEKLREILKRLANDNIVCLNHNSYLYTVLKKHSANAGISVIEYVHRLGFSLQMTSAAPEMPEEEKTLEASAIKEGLNILKNIQTEYSHIRTEAIKIKRNQILVKVLKSLYKGRCQLCGDNGNIPPIYDAKGERYCEVHHINPISSIRTGSDITEIDSYKNTIVLCPFHHSYLHHQNGGGFILANKGGKLFLDNHQGDSLEIKLNYHINTEQ